MTFSVTCSRCKRTFRVEGDITAGSRALERHVAEAHAEVAAPTATVEAEPVRELRVEYDGGISEC